MSGGYIDKVGEASGGQLVDLGQGELIFFLYLTLKSEISPRITLAVGKLQSNGSQNMKEHVWKVD